MIPSASGLRCVAICAGLSLWAASAGAVEPRTIADPKMTFVAIPAGQFTMGSPANEPGRSKDEGPFTKVTISKEFWMAETELTQAQWKSVMKSDVSEQMTKALTDDTVYNIDGYKTKVRDYYKYAKDFDAKSSWDNRGDDVPMYWVNWNEAKEFCKKLNEREAGKLPAGYVYRLPTEAEWEYACRAGTTEATYVGPLKIIGKNNAPILDEIAWYKGNASVGWTGRGASTDSWEEMQYPGGKAVQRSAAAKKPNAWGLYDMLGNVWEWCEDWYGPQLPGGEVTDPTGPESGLKHVSRGGSWIYGPAGARSAKRFQDEPGARFRCVGFRVVLAPEIKKAK